MMKTNMTTAPPRLEWTSKKVTALLGSDSRRIMTGKILFDACDHVGLVVRR